MKRTILLVAFVLSACSYRHDSNATISPVVAIFTPIPVSANMPAHVYTIQPTPLERLTAWNLWFDVNE